MRAALARQLRGAGPATGALIYDLDTGSTLFALRDGTVRPPASVEKLYTTVAVLRRLGPDARLQTAVLGSGHLGAGGVWHGRLYLRGGGDPTFGDGTFNTAWDQGYGPTAQQLAEQLTRDGIHRVTGALIGDGSLFDSSPGGPATRLAPDIPDYGGELGALTYDHGATGSSARLSPAAFAARELALVLRAAHVKAHAVPATAATPPGARVLASVESPPMSILLRLMDVPSDDLFADLLTEQLGARFGGSGSIAAGAGVISEAMASYGLHPKLVDGSGLSRSDGSSPRQIVDLLRAVWHTPVGDGLRRSLAVVGVNGTVAELARHSPAQGHCVAKTGTLDNVTNLAGYCHARGGHELAFALLLDGPTNSRATILLGRIVAAIARYS